MLENEITPWNVVAFRDDARKRLKKGLDTVADAVGATLGPRGRCVLIQETGRPPVVTKDGISVAKAINLRDPAQRAGADLIKEAASRTADVAGDGTTTATVIAQAMVTEGLKLMDRDFNANRVKQGIEWGVGEVVSRLKKMSREVKSDDELVQIATISANGDKATGELIASAVKKVGKLGVVTVDDAKGAATSLDFVEGMQVPAGWLNSYFVTNPDKMQAVLEDCYVLLCERKVSALKDLVPLLEAIQKSQKPLLIVAEDVEGDALQGLIINKMKGVIRACAVKVPGWGASRQAVIYDLAALTGANVVSPATGLALEKVTLSDLGRARRATADKGTTTIVASQGTEEKVAARAKEIQGQLEDPSLGADERASLQERLGKLTSGAAVIKVGGLTEVEVREKRDRIDDAICATRAALEEGVVPGGGVALLRAACAFDPSRLGTGSWDVGVKIVMNACLAPIKKIAGNAGHSPEVIVDKLRSAKGEFDGWNAATAEYGDMLSFGVIDPHKVTRCALEHAASVAGIFLTLDAAVLEDVGSQQAPNT